MAAHVLELALFSKMRPGAVPNGPPFSMASSTQIVAYLALFASVGFLLVFAALLIGRFLRARAPSPEKGEIYECGEPAVGTGFVQFDLRFYVVALLFIIFDVEVALFFPWATVFGKATQLKDPEFEKVVQTAADRPGEEPGLEYSPEAKDKLGELGIADPQLPDETASAEENQQEIESRAGRLALIAMADIAIFFAVLMVGFAYVWYRGDLNWVRAFRSEAPAEAERPEEALAGAEAERDSDQ